MRPWARWHRFICHVPDDGLRCRNTDTNFLVRTWQRTNEIMYGFVLVQVHLCEALRLGDFSPTAAEFHSALVGARSALVAVKVLRRSADEQARYGIMRLKYYTIFNNLQLFFCLWKVLLLWYKYDIYLMLYKNIVFFSYVINMMFLLCYKFDISIML